MSIPSVIAPWILDLWSENTLLLHQWIAIFTRGCVLLRAWLKHSLVNGDHLLLYQ